MLLRFTFLSIYSDFQQYLSHVLQVYYGKNKDSLPSSASLDELPQLSGHLLITFAPKRTLELSYC